MRGAVSRHRRSRWRHLAWLPAVALFATVAGLAAPVLFIRMSPDQAASEARGSVAFERWTLSATVRSEPSRALVVNVELVAEDQDNMQPPPWPVVSALMRGHTMTERPQTRALGPTRFQAVFGPVMAGAWTVDIEADGNSLQIPVTVR